MVTDVGPPAFADSVEGSGPELVGCEAAALGGGVVSLADAFDCGAGALDCVGAELGAAGAAAELGELDAGAAVDGCDTGAFAGELGAWVGSVAVGVELAVEEVCGATGSAWTGAPRVSGADCAAAATGAAALAC